MKFFDTKPKSDPNFLYGREKELEKLSEYVSNKDWVILLGPRRIGKTSLARCAITKLKFKSVIIDARDNDDFKEALTTALINSETSLNIKAGVKIPHIPISAEVNYNKTFLKNNLNKILGKIKKLVILVDEAQWLKNPKGVVKLLAYIYDNYYDSITFIITGSEIGVMKSIVEPGAQSALYGRAITKMEIKKWQSPTSLGFLKKGSEEVGLQMDDKTAIKIEESLDGIPGWLTLFGYNYAHEKNPNIAITNTLIEAKKIVSQEIKNIGKLGIGSQKLIEVLYWLSKEPLRFKDISERTKLNNTTLSKHLSTLERLGFIEKNKNKYFITDPVLEEFLKTKKPLYKS